MEVQVQVEHLIRMQERALKAHEERVDRWQEHTTELVRIMRGIEQRLTVLRPSSALSSTASVDALPPEKHVKNRDGGDANEKAGAMAYTGPVQAKPYPHRPYAVGLRAVRRCSDDWRPAWTVFPLKAFRGSSYAYLKIQSHWDDADLLQELSRSYDKLRTVWRKWFSLRGVRSVFCTIQSRIIVPNNFFAF